MNFYKIEVIILIISFLKKQIHHYYKIEKIPSQRDFFFQRYILIYKILIFVL